MAPYLCLPHSSLWHNTLCCPTKACWNGADMLKTRARGCCSYFLHLRLHVFDRAQHSDMYPLCSLPFKSERLRITMVAIPCSYTDIGAPTSQCIFTNCFPPSGDRYNPVQKSRAARRSGTFSAREKGESWPRPQGVLPSRIVIESCALLRACLAFLTQGN